MDINSGHSREKALYKAFGDGKTLCQLSLLNVHFLYP